MIAARSNKDIRFTVSIGVKKSGVRSCAIFIGIKCRLIDQHKTSILGLQKQLCRLSGAAAYTTILQTISINVNVLNGRTLERRRMYQHGLPFKIIDRMIGLPVAYR